MSCIQHLEFSNLPNVLDLFIPKDPNYRRYFNNIKFSTDFKLHKFGGDTARATNVSFYEIFLYLLNLVNYPICEIFMHADTKLYTPYLYKIRNFGNNMSDPSKRAVTSVLSKYTHIEQSNLCKLPLTPFINNIIIDYTCVIFEIDSWLENNKYMFEIIYTKKYNNDDIDYNNYDDYDNYDNHDNYDDD
jgi:hypothetical protein